MTDRPRNRLGRFSRNPENPNVIVPMSAAAESQYHRFKNPDAFGSTGAFGRDAGDTWGRFGSSRPVSKEWTRTRDNPW